MVMIIVQAKGTQKNLLWCMGILLCPNHLQVKGKIWKKKKTKTKKHENGVEHKKVSFLAVSLRIGES